MLLGEEREKKKPPDWINKEPSKGVNKHDLFFYDE